MSRIISAFIFTALLAGCDGKNPFMPDIEVIDEDSVDSELVDANDPNTEVANRFAYQPDRNITMNSVEYSETDNTLVINNLPFDGPDGVYDDVPGQESINANGQVSNIYQNRENTINGEMQYYAMFVQSDYLEATSAGGRNWGDFGFAGANVNRDSFAIPAAAQTSYVFVGVYAGTRTYEGRGGIELISGNATLLLDVADTDPLDGLQGTIVGSISGRTRNPIGETMVGDLPPISLESVNFNTETGVWEGGVATSEYNNEIRDTGTHEGMIAGPNGEEMGGYVIIEGVADIQTVTFQIVDWQLITTNTDAFGNVFTTTTTGQVSGLAIADSEVVQNQVNAGIDVGVLGVGLGDIPPGATIQNTTTDTTDISTDYDAREIGVFVTDLDP